MVLIERICTQRGKRFLLPVVLSAWSLTTTTAQDQLKLQQEKNIGAVSRTDEIIGVINNNNSNGTVRLYKKESGRPKVVSNNQFGGRQMPVFESGLILENGRKIVLPSNEEISGYTDNKIFTIKRDWAADGLVVNMYSVNGETTAKKSTKSFGSAEISASFMKNNYLIVSDGGEGSGLSATTFGIYDESLNLVVGFESLPDGFGFYSMDSDADNLVVASGNDPNLNIAILSRKTGKVKTERTFSIPGYSVRKAFLFKNSIILYGTDAHREMEIACYDLQLNRIWARKSVMGRSDNGVRCMINDDESKLFYVNSFSNNAKQLEFKIVCLNMIDGAVLWEYGLQDTAEKSLEGYRYNGFYVTDLDYLPARKAVVVTASHLFTNIQTPHQYEYIDGRLIAINEQGGADEKILGSEGKPFILKNGKHVKVISRNKVYLYE
jgi:hypothetical protein